MNALNKHNFDESRSDMKEPFEILDDYCNDNE